MTPQPAHGASLCTVLAKLQHAQKHWEVPLPILRSFHFYLQLRQLFQQCRLRLPKGVAARVKHQNLRGEYLVNKASYDRNSAAIDRAPGARSKSVEFLIVPPSFKKI